MKCGCPSRCLYCGRPRSRDSVGHYCKTRNCQWQHGYSTCKAPTVSAERQYEPLPSDLDRWPETMKRKGGAS